MSAKKGLLCLVQINFKIALSPDQKSGAVQKVDKHNQPEHERPQYNNSAGRYETCHIFSAGRAREH